ncbi:MAG: GNAT family N-acetyltransferase [Oscillibacter sp.]|nr:GNAT family N-acetyltransferase [Oscillibacter sp.]
MATLELEVVQDDTPSVTCEFPSLNQMMKDAYYRTILKQAKAYHILYNGKRIGGCMVKFVLLCDEEYTVGDDDSFPACEISYLVLDETMRGKRIGRYVLDMLIKETRDWAEKIPIRFLIIEAFANLRNWYEGIGFKTYDRAQKSPAYINTVSMRMDFADREELERYAESQF